MKKLLLMSLMLFGIAYYSVAQKKAKKSSKEENMLSKEETNAWKKRMKSTSIQDFKSMIDANQQLKKDLKTVRNELEIANSQSLQKNDKIESQKQEMTSLQEEIDQMSQAFKQLAQEKRNQSGKGGTGASASTGGGSSSSRAKVSVKGVIFKVQIGAFKNKNLTSYVKNSDTFTADKTDGGLKAYSLGLFKDYWEADKFKKYLREMGVKDAWVVSYKNGKRIPMKEVLSHMKRR